MCRNEKEEFYRRLLTQTVKGILFKPITSKVSGALSDEYVEQIKACARKATAQQTAAPAVSGGESASFNVKA